MIQADRNPPGVPSRGAASLVPFAGAANPARQLSSGLDKELAGYHGHPPQFPPGPVPSADRLHAAPPSFTAAAHTHDWLLADGYPAFLAADASSPWDPSDYVYSSGSMAMAHADGFGQLIGDHDSGQAQSDSGFGWAAVPASAAATAPSKEAAPCPALARRNSTASSCAGSSCSSACVYGEQCGIAEPCELGGECDLDQPCELGHECGLDRPCDASDCDEEPVCVDESCSACACEETKAAATLASFVASNAGTVPSLQRQQHLNPLRPSHQTLLSASSAVQQQAPAQHAHCGGSTIAPQTVIQHLIERHNDPSAESCVRPCLVDQPLNYAVCPMPCLLEHPQLHGNDYRRDEGIFFTALDNNNLMDCYSPSVLAPDCGAHWTSGDELLQHWHMQHRAMFLHSQQQQHHSHHVEQPFSSMPSHGRLNTPPYMSSQEDPLAVQTHLSLGSSPATSLTNDPSTIPTPPTSGPTVLSPPPTIPGAQHESGTGLDDGSRAGGPDVANEPFRCLWCDAPGVNCCGKVFDNAKELNLHVIGYHVKVLERSDGGYVCGWKGCKRSSEGKKGFPQKSKIERHVQTHTGEKPYACPTCHITFSAKQALDQHELIHKGSKPLPCEFPGCDKTFRQQSARTMHMRTHTKVKPLACNICGRRFSESSNLSKHRRTHAEVGAFMCRHPGCSKTFHRLDQLRRHKKTHETKIKIRRGGGYPATPVGGPGAPGDDGAAGDSLGESAGTSPDMSDSEPL